MEKEKILSALNLRTFYYSLVPSLRKENGKGEAIGLCPFHDDHNPSLSVNLNKGLWNCLAGCGGGDLFDFYMRLKVTDFKTALRDIAEIAGVESKESRVVATYEYKNIDGKILYIKERIEPGPDGRKKTFCFKHQENSQWVTDRGSDPLPYNLPALNKVESAFVVEGEGKADLLSNWCLVATCLDSGANSPWRDDYLQALSQKERIVILPDNDKAGRSYALKIAKALHGKVKSIKLVELPGLPDKGDITDWVTSGGTKEKLLRLIDEAPEWEEREAIKNTKAPETRETQAEKLIRIGSELTLFHDEMKEGHTEIAGQNVKVRSGIFKQYLSRALWEREKKAPNSDSLNQALNVLEAKAIFDGTTRRLFNRIASHEEAILYDLGDGRVVRITPGRWEIVTDQPMMFKRYPHQQPQVEPKRGGDLRNLFKYLNILNEDHRLLTQVLLVSYYLPEIARPILHPWGDQGSGKTTICVIFKLLIDPSKLSVFFAPRDLNETVQALEHHYFLAFDNLSDIPGWLSDLLSQAVTGAGLSKRKLYTDDEDHIFQLKRCIAINGINQLIYKPDAMDRSILIRHTRIAPDHQRSERELFAEFEHERPYLLGAVFEALAQGLEIRPTIHLAHLPRMADFALWGCAISSALGYTQEAFIEAYQNNVKTRNNEVIGGNTLAQAVLSFMEDKEEWEGTVKEAFDKLYDTAKPKDKDNTFPKAPNKLRSYLERIRTNLQEFGVKFEISDYNTVSGVPITFQKIGKVSSESSGHSDTSLINDSQDEDTLNILEPGSGSSGVSSGQKLTPSKDYEDNEHTEDKIVSSWSGEDEASTPDDGDCQDCQSYTMLFSPSSMELEPFCPERNDWCGQLKEGHIIKGEKINDKPTMPEI